MAKRTFTRDFDKRLDSQTSVHYLAGQSYDVSDELLGEVADFVEPAGKAPADQPPAVDHNPPGEAPQPE
jgi:hypothetical protein